MEPQRERMRVRVRGAVQGVGFRPFAYRLAVAEHLDGWVGNDLGGVVLEIEGPGSSLARFLTRLTEELPAPAHIHGLEPVWLPVNGHAGSGFAIRPSLGAVEEGGGTWAQPDIAVCADCRRELFDPTDRRYRYPFLNCAHCGPRYTILEALPYDRATTSMRRFPMCPQCRAEYADPANRRFHAEPIACPVCGPRLAWWDGRGVERGTDEGALEAAIACLRDGGIVAVKGIGGFHLWVRADDGVAVRRLRERKGREAKPFALMFPDLASVRAVAEVAPLEARLLSSPEAPIVLLRRAGQGAGVAPEVAPGNAWVGALLPYAPLHLLMLDALRFPVVATSGNRSGDPICIDEGEAVERLGGIADGFLVHNRPIVRAVDDSVVRVMVGREVVLRRARGFVPAPVGMPTLGVGVKAERAEPVLALGADLKGAVAVSDGRRRVLGQHLGDLDSAVAQDGLAHSARDLGALLGIGPRRVVVDAHPGYVSTQYGRGLGLPVTVVQHHHAHVLACVAENDAELPVLGVAWDGTGDGMDGTVWGGECLRVTAAGFSRFASFRPFRLPGGEAAVREPRRTAFGLLDEMLGEDASRFEGCEDFVRAEPVEARIWRTQLRRGFHSPWCTSVGRLLDAVAALAGLCQINRYEGEAAMTLEFAAEGAMDEAAGAYPFSWADWREGRGQAPARVIDWEPAVRRCLRDLHEGCPASRVAARFLLGLVEVLVTVCREAGERRVALSGGCFQNRILTEGAVRRLREDGFEPLWHQRVPPNDGGIAYGQLVAAALAEGTVIKEEIPCA